MRKKSLIIALMLIVGVFATGFTVYAESQNDVVSVPDTYLKKLINVTLKKPEDEAITKGDMAKLKTLDTNDIPLITEGVKRHTHGIKDLTGLEYAVNLEVLDVKQNEITDLSPISNLQKIVNLDVNRNELVDISPIKNLKTLEILTIYNNKITSIDALAGLTNLKDIDMHHVNRQTSKIDITPLSNLVNLEKLDIGENLIEDISCLKPVVDSGKLRWFSVRGDCITDFTVIKPLLDELYIDNFGSSETLIIGTTLQKSLNAPIEANVPAEGGKVEVKLPEIKGFEDVDQFWAGMFEMSTTKVVGFPESAPEDIKNTPVTYDAEKNVAVIDFKDNTIGKKKDVKTNIVIAYEMTDFTYEMPIHIVQDAKFNLSLKTGENKQIINMNTKDWVSDEFVEGELVDTEGNPIKLKDVKVEFKKTGGNFDQSVLEAHNLKLDGNKFTFKLAKKKGADEPKPGNRTLSPTIKFQVVGDDTWYNAPEKYNIYNLFISDSEPLSLSTEVVFDLASEPNAEGKYTSKRFEVKLPGGREPSWITVNNSNNKQVYTSSSDKEWQDGNKSGFSLTLSPEQMNDTFYIRIAQPFANKESNIEIWAKPKFVYSKKDQTLEDQFTHNLKDGISVGESKEFVLSYNNKACTGFNVTSADDKILSADGKKLKGVAEGKTTITMSGIKFNYVVSGVEFAGVEYENPVTKEIVVKAAKNPAGAGQGAGDDSQGPSTGDDMQILFWAFAGLLALGGAAFGITKKKSRN